jgi:hypothetical protein
MPDVQVQVEVEMVIVGYYMCTRVYCIPPY